MEYQKAINTQSLKPGMMTKVSLAGEDILLANVEGEFFATTNVCTHMGGSLVDGRLEGNIVRCPWHGSGFDVRTGKLKIRPKILFFKGNAADLKTYPVKVENGEVLVGII